MADEITAAAAEPGRAPARLDWSYAPAPEATDHVKLREDYGLLIGGRWVAPLSGSHFKTINPATEEVLASVAEAGEDDVDAAVKAAIADGKPRSDAQFLTTWVRNQNPRLRTLPLASGLVVKLWSSCEEGGGHNLLTTLSANARQKGLYYYTLTLAGGKVQRIQERLAINAC
jgi:hypothetical protein